MTSEVHCDACRLFAEARRDVPEAYDQFALLCRGALSQGRSNPPCALQVLSAWLNDFQLNFRETVVPGDVCVLEWATGRLRAYAEDPYRDTVARWYAGDAAAFERLYAETRSPLVAKATRIVGAEAEDLVEDFFVELYESWARGRSRFVPYRGAFLPYAFRCIISRAYTQSSRTRRRRELEERMFELASVQTSSYIFDDHEFALDVLKVVDSTQLEPNERAALELSADGWSGEEIAEILGMSPPTVTRRLANAFAKIASRMREFTPADQLVSALRELTASHKERAAAVFIHYALPEIDGAAREAGLRALPWPTKAEAASSQVAELYRRLVAESPEHPVCQLIRDHAAEPWGVLLREEIDR